MPDPAERFIEAAIRPLEDNAELQIAARRELAEMIDTADGGALETAADRLEKTAPRRIWMSTALAALSLVLILWSLGTGGKSALIYWRALGFTPKLPSAFDPTREQVWSRELPVAHRLLLVGDLTKPTKSERMKALWDSEPRNPAYFAEYSIHHLKDHDRLPADFLETAAELDPENGWFIFLAAGTSSKAALEKLPRTARQKKDGALPEYRIRDEALFNEALGLLSQAVSLPRFDSYQTSLHTLRAPLLPEATDLAGQIIPMAYVAGSPAANMHMRYLTDLVQAKAALLAAAGDAEGFRGLLADWEKVLGIWAAGNEASLIDTLIFKILIGVPSERLWKIAEELGMPDEAARWKAIAEWKETDREARRNTPFDDISLTRGNMLAGYSMAALTNYPNAPGISATDFAPSRLAEHELFQWTSSILLWTALGCILLGTVFYPFRASILIRRISRQMECLLRPMDWIWILGAGVFVPFFYYQAIYRLISLGTRDCGIGASDLAIPLGQLGAMGGLMILAPVLIARWRLSRRAGACGLKTGRPWLGLAAVACGALAIPIFGFGFHHDMVDGNFITGGKILLAAMLAAWLAIGARAIFSRRRHLLRRVTLSRLLIPAYAFGMLLIAAVIPFYHAAERDWIAQDKLTGISTDAPAMTRYEHKVAQAMRQELLEILGAAP